MTNRELMIDLEAELTAKHLWYDSVYIGKVSQNTHLFVTVYEVQGDWKHDHLFLNNTVMFNWAVKHGYFIESCEETVTDNDESDCYHADHRYELIPISECLVNECLEDLD